MNLSSPRGEGGGGSGIVVGIFTTFSKKIYQNPYQGEKIIVKIGKKKWFTSHLLFKIGRSKAWCQVKISILGICVTVKFPWVVRTPPPPPPPHRAYIDRCIQVRVTIGDFPIQFSIYTSRRIHHVFWSWEACLGHPTWTAVAVEVWSLSFGAGTGGLRFNDINRRMQLLQSLVVYSLALFYGLLICLRVLWETIRKLKIPPGAKRRETRKQKISWGSEIFTYFWQCVSNYKP